MKVIFQCLICLIVGIIISLTKELYAIGRADRALTVFMKFGVDGQKSYHLQLKIAVAMVPRPACHCGTKVPRKLVCARWATLAADSAVVPGTSVLFTVHAVTDEGGEVWLHTHGLNVAVCMNLRF